METAVHFNKGLGQLYALTSRVLAGQIFESLQMTTCEQMSIVFGIEDPLQTSLGDRALGGMAVDSGPKREALLGPGNRG